MVLSRTGECAAVVLVSEISWESGDEREIGVWSDRPTVICVNECEISPVEGGDGEMCSLLLVNTVHRLYCT